MSAMPVQTGTRLCVCITIVGKVVPFVFHLCEPNFVFSFVYRVYSPSRKPFQRQYLRLPLPDLWSLHHLAFVIQRLRPFAQVMSLVDRPSFFQAPALLVRSKSIGLLDSVRSKRGRNLTQRSTRTQPLRSAVRFCVCDSQSLFRVRPAAGPVNFHR